MSSINQSTLASRLFDALLVAVAILLVAAVETGAGPALGLDNGLAFWLLFLVGMTICARGPLGQGERYGWTNWRHLLGYVLGAVALFIGAAVLFNFSLPAIGGERAAVLALGLVMAVKVAIARLYPRPAARL